MSFPFEFDFKTPDYHKVWEWRLKVINKIRETGTADEFKKYYKDHPVTFISHWGNTFDPRNAERNLPTIIPFVLFPRQEEWCEWVLAMWRGSENGLCDKSRDMGVTWLAVALASTLCLFNDGISVGIGSRKQDLVDHIGDPKCIFWKARMFINMLPHEFKCGWDIKQHAPFMRLTFPETKSTITGESGDGIGRGDRQSIYLVDEAAWLEHPETVDASLSNTTNCRIDMSSVNGMNSFGQKRFSYDAHKIFTFHWRSDPRKDQEWYEKKCKEINNPVIVAQEIDINYSASVEGVVIPNEWIQAAVNFCKEMGIEPTGDIDAALDVADEGIDLNAFCIKHGIEIKELTSWSGKNSDTLFTAEKAFILCDQFEVNEFLYDADGLGASIRGDSRMINERRKENKERFITVKAFRGSGEVIKPDAESVIKGRKNKDFFSNRKAQGWWALRTRFQNTFRARQGEPFDKDEVISIPSKLAEGQKLLVELSQPTYSLTVTGKIVIDKAPDNTRSPNLADAVMMDYAPKRSGMFY